MQNTPGMASNRRLGQGIKLEAINHEVSKQKIDNLLTQANKETPVITQKTPQGKVFEISKENIADSQQLKNQIDINNLPLGRNPSQFENLSTEVQTRTQIGIMVS